MTLTIGTELEQAGERDLPSSMVGRMTLILDTLGKRGIRLTLEEIERRTGLPRSTTHRILCQLLNLGWVEHGPYGYSLGTRAFQLAASSASWDELRRASAPVLHDLHVRTGLVSHLCTLDGPETVFLDKIGGAYAARLPSDVGSRWWATNSGIGKAILAYLPAEQVDELLRSCPEFAKSTDDGFGSLHCELNTIRRVGGLHFDRGEAMPGVGAIACAVRGPNGPAGAISVCGDLPQIHFERLAPMVAAGARRISEALFPTLGDQACGPMVEQPPAADGGQRLPSRFSQIFPRGCCGHFHP
ncbi:IclR family transcriptional regulator [Sphaerimonospora thailandensis]|uniref:Transcriptional regulator n=1 Tax=Sphaerimonospora thailandensis TaxID=795644 RepID=A0A8J3RAP8_9ACTN|nr:IclR family transcriptional regulator [Sphaerimonospora thailandensis]GIH70437.1 transcriptional regulator [Sphaerimonospora thailandensis]